MVRSRVIRTLERGVSPAGVFFVLTGLFSGLFWTFFTERDDVKNTLLFQFANIDNLHAYGIALLVGAVVVLYGLLRPNRVVLQVGSMIMFVSYLYAGIIYFTNSLWYPFFAVSVPYLLIYGYFFLAAAFAKNLPRS